MLFLLFLLAMGYSPAQEPVPGRGLRLQPFDPLPGLIITAINGNGDIAGNHVLYGAVLVKSGGALQVLGFDGRVSGLNDRGQMLINGDDQVFLRQPDGTMEPRTLDGAKSLYGYGLNNRGEIVGAADRDAVAWDASGKGRKIVLPGSGSYTGRNRALAINDNGEMIVETQAPGGSFPFYRRAANGQFSGGGTSKYGVAHAGLSNNGDLFYSAVKFVQGRETRLLDAADRTLYSANDNFSPWNEKSENIDRISLIAASLDGTRFAGAGFLATPCTVAVRSRAMFTALNTGAVPVDVSADDDCHWYAWQTYRGTESVTVPVTGNVGSAPRVYAAGVDIPIPLEGSCQYASPIGQFKAPVEGAEFTAPVQTAPGCAWTIGVGPGITAKPMSGSGPGEVTVTVAPSTAFADEVKRYSIAGILRSIEVEGWRCFYDVDALLPFGAGSGAGLVTVSTHPACRWSLYSQAPWIHVSGLSFDPIFRFDPNPSGSPRSAEISVGGKRITVTQAAASPGTPQLVEPNSGSGPSAVFRFTLSPGEGMGTQIRIGEDCLLQYDRMANTFTPSGGACTWTSTEVRTMGEFVILTAGVDFHSRGPLPIVAGDHLLGVFTAADAFPEPPVPIEPAEDIGWLPPAHYQLNRTAGTGGLFRFVFSARYPVVESNIGNCYFVLDVAKGTLQLNSEGQPKRIGSEGRIENNRCVIDLERSRLSPGSAKHVLELAIQFRSTSTGEYITGTQFALPTDPSPGRYLSGEFTVLPSVEPPTALFLDGLLRVGFPARVPVDRARVVIGTCSVEYRGPGQFEATGCELEKGESHVIGNDLILLLRFQTPVSGALSAEQMPRGGIASGLMPLGTIGLE
ncbi:MAG: BACON domain-containing carbohydrate-binding protein [Bryobacteraceae bacterium]